MAWLREGLAELAGGSGTDVHFHVQVATAVNRR